MTPEWMLKDENYIPESDKDTFINKSILSILGILSRIKVQSGYRKDSFHVSAIWKVAFTFVMIVLLSISRSFTFVIIVNVYLLLALSMMKANEILKILKVSFIVALFTFVILLPSVFLGYYYSVIMITPKVFATVLAVNIMSHTTQWNAITGALRTFLIPDIFILVLDITIKYIMLLGEFSLNLLYSLKLRSVGINNKKYSSLSGVAGTMFIKSKEMAEDMYAAMECRGFSGEYRIYKKLSFTFYDFFYVIVNGLIIFAFFYLRKA